LVTKLQFQTDNLKVFELLWVEVNSCVCVPAAGDVRQELWKTLPHSDCYKGIHAGTHQDYKSEVQSVRRAAEPGARLNTGTQYYLLQVHARLNTGTQYYLLKI